MRREIRQNVVWQGWRPADNDVPHVGVARTLGLLFPRRISVRIARSRIPEF